MGQPIEVTARQGSRPQIMIFSINRSVTGMKIEEYRDPANASGERWCDELARRLGDLGVTRVTVYASDVIAEAPAWGHLTANAQNVIRDLYIYYVDGKIPEGDYTGEEESAEPAEQADEPAPADA